MDDITFDRLIKTLAASSGRRQALRMSIGGILAGALAGMAQDAAAKKRRGKRRGKNQSPPPPPPPLTCAESCASNCLLCLHRPGAAPLCGDGWQILCEPCTSDADCVGKERPYCITHKTERSTGEVIRWDNNPPPTGCAPYPVGICTKVLDCNDI